MNRWKDILKSRQETLKAFYDSHIINDMYMKLDQEIEDWAALEKKDIGAYGDLNTIKGRLWQIQKAIKGEETDLVKHFIKLYELIDNDYDIQKLGDELYEALKWREDNE
tara:strand:- start:1270 stop:1596 length:327 start_codon:yes stop_codon:yes gene_type:complete